MNSSQTPLPRFVSRLARPRHPGTDRWPAAAASWRAASAPDRVARQAGRAVRRQVPHHRFHAVQLRQLRHPPDRRADPVQGAFADPAHPARLGLPARRARRVRRAAAGAAADGRDHWYAAPPTRSTRTSTSSAARPSYVLVLAGDHIYKMDYGPMIAYHVEFRRRHHGRLVEVPLPEARAFGVMTSTPTWNRSPVRREAGPTPSRCRATPMPWRWPRWASTCSTPISCSSCCEDAADPTSSHDFGKDIIPQWSPTAARCSPTRSATWQPTGAGLLARRRHGGRLLGGQPGADHVDARAESLRRGLADLDLPGAAAAGQVRARRRRAHAAWRSIRWSPAAASSPARWCALAAVLQRARARLAASRTPWCCPTCTSGATAACAAQSSTRAASFPRHARVIGDDARDDASASTSAPEASCWSPGNARSGARAMSAEQHRCASCCAGTCTSREYRDALTGEYQLPWTYLHAIKDYADMAAHLEQARKARAVVNFTPVLLEQLAEYAHRSAHLRETVRRCATPCSRPGRSRNCRTAPKRALLKRLPARPPNAHDRVASRPIARLAEIAPRAGLAQPERIGYLSDQCIWRPAGLVSPRLAGRDGAS
jgi:hypothetical protein